MNVVIETLKRMLFDFIVNVIASNCLVLSPIRYHFYRLAGIDTHTSQIKKKCFIRSKEMHVGKKTLINFHCKFYTSDHGGTITIGNNCNIGMNVIFCTFTHEIGDVNKRAGKTRYLPIIIEDGVWIGTNSTILPNVKIGKGCIIAAGTVVNKDCEPNGLYAGVPAKRIKDLLQRCS